MSVISDMPGKVCSVVAAAMETYGLNIQAEMLQLVNGADGQLLAGLLFLIAIIGAVLVFAVGGSYRWGRYLLVGPALFFFLTQVTTGAKNTEWTFGDAEFPSDYRSKALRGVFGAGLDSAQGGGTDAEGDVSTFFHFWNVFMSNTAQELIKLLNLVEDDSHLNFITKIERYMNFWNNPEAMLDDPLWKQFIRVTLKDECADYFALLMLMANPHVSDAMKSYYRPLLEERAAVKVKDLQLALPQDEDQGGEMYEAIMRELRGENPQLGEFAPEGAYTCQQLWEATVNGLKPIIRETILAELEKVHAPEQDKEKTKWVFYRKLFTETSRATSMTRIYDAAAGNVDDMTNDPEFGRALARAVDWVLARALFKEIWDQNRFIQYFNLEHASGNRAVGLASPTMQADQVMTTANAIQQFNQAEVYKFKADYVNAALSMPHFQGVLLMLLAAAYPFFAMMVLLPGRAGAMLTWMGLWAWLKFWDVGFAVVMMIDNILYAMFPRGPELAEDDINNAGKVWMRVMEIDPNYASATYYNLVATCLFAVPVATGVFVKGGAKELVGLAHNAWENYSSRLGDSAAAFANSLQAQSYAGRFQRQKSVVMRAAAHKQHAENAHLLQKIGLLQKAKGALGSDGARAAIDAAIPGTNLSSMGNKLVQMGRQDAGLAIDEEIGRLRRENATSIFLAGHRAAFDYSVSRSGFWASESAVAARYYSHDFRHPYPGKQAVNAYIAQRAYDKDGLIANAGQNLKEMIKDLGRSAVGGSSK